MNDDVIKIEINIVLIGLNYIVMYTIAFKSSTVPKEAADVTPI